MPRRVLISIGWLLLLALAVFGSASSSQAKPLAAGTPQDLVDAVNALRASFGLPLYSVSPILMSTAQAQADFMASTGTMTHAGPGGIGLTERLLAAGYPLAGDLSLGGFRAENITGGNEDMPPEQAVDRWTGDAPHLNTMVSQYLTEIGAGVAISNGRVYYVIDAARPTSALDLPPAATSPVDGSPVIPDASPDLIIPVSVSTPNAEGHVFHEVKFGQTLWQIAITYETKIDEIKRLNNLPDNNIYPGNRLLIRSGGAVTAVAPAASATLASTATVLPALTLGVPTFTADTEAASSPAAVREDGTLMRVMIGIVALALLGGGLFTWLGSSRKP